MVDLSGGDAYTPFGSSAASDRVRFFMVFVSSWEFAPMAWGYIENPLVSPVVSSACSSSSSSSNADFSRSGDC